MCQYYFVHRKSHMDWLRVDPGLGGYSLFTDRKNRFPPQGKNLNTSRKDQSGNVFGVIIIIIIFGVIVILFWVNMMLFRARL
jgi:hypothetical protein